MPVELPPESALREFLGATTRHTRRVEIYEQDGVTRWAKDKVNRLKSGNVSVDYDRSERRALDLVLDNTDRVLMNAPGEFWYDKIIKVFRGVQIFERERLPKILVVADGGEGSGIPTGLRDALSAAGFGDVRINPAASSVLDLVGYDVVVGINSTNAAKNQLIRDAYDLGYPVVTLGETSVATHPSMFGSGATDSLVTFDSNGPAVSPLNISHKLARGWSSFLYTFGVEDEGLPVVTNPITGFQSISQTGSGEQLVSVVQDEGRTWVMYHAPVVADLFDKAQFRNFLMTTFAWINPVEAIDEWEVQIGEFMIDRISEAHFPHEVKITGRDYTKKCMKSKFAHATQFDAGQNLEDVIAAIAGSAGISKRLLPETGIIIGRDFFFDADTSRWDAMKELATSYNQELYFDATGYLVMRPFNDPAQTPPSIVLETGKKGQLASYEKSTTDADLYNFIVVVGEGSDSSLPNVWAIAKNEDPSSPTSVQELGERTHRYASSFIETEQQAQDLADSFLSIYAMEAFELSFESLMLPWLEVGDIMGWVDPNPAPGDPSTFLLSSLSIPLALGPMSGMGKRITSVS